MGEAVVVLEPNRKETKFLNMLDGYLKESKNLIEEAGGLRYIDSPYEVLGPSQAFEEISGQVKEAQWRVNTAFGYLKAASKDVNLQKLVLIGDRQLRLAEVVEERRGRVVEDALKNNLASRLFVLEVGRGMKEDLSLLLLVRRT